MAMNFSISDYVWSHDLDKIYVTGCTKNALHTVKLRIGSGSERIFTVYSGSDGYVRIFIRDILEQVMMENWIVSQMFTLTCFQGTTAPSVPLTKTFVAVLCSEDFLLNYNSPAHFAEKNFLTTAPQAKALAELTTFLGVDAVSVFSTDVDESSVTFNLEAEYLTQDGMLEKARKTVQVGISENVAMLWPQGVYYQMTQDNPDLAAGVLKSFTVTAGQRWCTYYITGEAGCTEIAFQTEFGHIERVQLNLDFEHTTKMSAEKVVLLSGNQSSADIKVEDQISASANVDLPTAMYLRRQLKSKNIFIRKCGTTELREMKLVSMEVKIVDSRSANIKLTMVDVYPGHVMPPDFSEGLSPNRIFSRHFSSPFS